jgi:hypothetical protein
LQLFACFAMISYCERSKNAASYGFSHEVGMGPVTCITLDDFLQFGIKISPSRTRGCVAARASWCRIAGRQRPFVGLA